MATLSASHIHLPSVPPVFAVADLGSASAARATELLQRNHEENHIFFNASGFHNHLAHHVLTLYALGATPNQLTAAYNDNTSYQRSLRSANEQDVAALYDLANWPSYLGKGKSYSAFLAFFSAEITAKGWQKVLSTYLFAGDERADDLLTRTFAGVLHPLIHIGFGVEFALPGIVAEGLAQAAVHDNWIPFLEWERAAQEQQGERKTIVELLEGVREDEALRGAVRWDDGSRFRDGVVGRAGEEIKRWLAQFTVREDELELRTAEHINAAVYFTAAAQRPPHAVKLDFFAMHCVNSSIFLSSFLHASFLSSSTKRRILEWKVRNDIALYASLGSPALDSTHITSYTPAHPGSWPAILKRATAIQDDGHAPKLVRALAHAELACRPFEGRDGFVVRSDMWVTLGHMAMDSVETGGAAWVRGSGFGEAWQEVPLRG